jgi:hypothetical protein
LFTCIPIFLYAPFKLFIPSITDTTYIKNISCIIHIAALDLLGRYETKNSYEKEQISKEICQ